MKSGFFVFRRMLDLANVLELLIHGLDERSLPEHQLVMQAHQQVLHVPLEPDGQVRLEAVGSTHRVLAQGACFLEGLILTHVPTVSASHVVVGLNELDDSYPVQLRQRL